MRLPDTMFRQILNALGLPGAPDAGAYAPDDVDLNGGRRRRQRHRVDAEVTVRRHGVRGSPLRVATLREFSAIGLCVLSPDLLAAGDRFVAYLPAVGTAGQVERYAPLLCTAKSCRVSADGRYRVGAEFTDPAETGLEQLPFLPEGYKPGLERWTRTPASPWADPDPAPRRADRATVGGEAVIHPCGPDDGPGPAERVDVRDVSPAGVAILRADPLEVGACFVLRLAAEGNGNAEGAGAKVVTHVCRVTNVGPADGRYRIGAEFVRPAAATATAKSKRSPAARARS